MSWLETLFVASLIALDNSRTDSVCSFEESGHSCSSSQRSSSCFQGGTQTDTPERRADRAQSLVLVGEVSGGRHALEGAPLAAHTGSVA